MTKASSTTMTCSTNSWNSLTVDEMMAEVTALKQIMSTLMARMDSLDDMKRQKRSIDARLDNFEERLADIHHDVSLLTPLKEEKNDDGFINLEGADWNGS